MSSPLTKLDLSQVQQQPHRDNEIKLLKEINFYINSYKDTVPKIVQHDTKSLFAKYMKENLKEDPSTHLKQFQAN